MRVLGVDPGLTRCGLGVVDVGAGRQLQLVDVRVAATSPDDDPAARVAAVADEVDAVIRQFAPEAVALERVFAQHNVRTVMGTAQVSGVVMLAAARAGLTLTTYTPSEVKAAVTGSGRANKAQVASMVARLLGLAEAPTPADAADALAIAMCHGMRGAGAQRFAQGSATAAQRQWAAAEKAAQASARRRPGPR